MKKLLIVLGSFTLVAGAGLSVVSCKASENKTYNQFREYLNRTKGEYDNAGNPLKKSGASVIYIGAKNNASSQSFEAALKNTFNNDLQEASRDLSKPWETVLISNPIRFEAAVAQLNTNNWSISNIPIAGLANKKADYVQVTLDDVKFDATFISQEDNKVSIQIIGFKENNSEDLKKALIDAFQRASSSINRVFSTIKLYELNNDALLDNKSELYNQWVASYQSNWMWRKNADRGVTDVKMQLRSKSNYYGAILEQPLTTPTYGIKGDGRKGINAPITVGFDYARPELDFYSLGVDRVSEYWNSDFFNRISSYLKEDILYQLGANNPIEQPGISEATEKNIPAITARVKQADTIVNKIKEAKGPLFLFIKNGHFVDARKGWNRYSKFGGTNNLGEGNYYSDLLSWAKELGNIWSQSAQYNLDSIAANGVQVWNYVTSDDGGADNWDWEKNIPVNKK